MVHTLSKYMLNIMQNMVKCDYKAENVILL